MRVATIEAVREKVVRMVVFESFRWVRDEMDSHLEILPLVQHKARHKMLGLFGDFFLPTDRILDCVILVLHFFLWVKGLEFLSITYHFFDTDCDILYELCISTFTFQNFITFPTHSFLLSIQQTFQTPCRIFFSVVKFWYWFDDWFDF